MRIQLVTKGDGIIFPLKKGKSPDGWKYQQASSSGLLVKLDPVDESAVIISNEVLESFGYVQRVIEF